MPALRNQRRELFAQGLARGISAVQSPFPCFHGDWLSGSNPVDLEIELGGFLLVSEAQ